MLHSSRTVKQFLCFSLAPSYPQQYPTPYPTPAGAAPYPTGSSPATQFPQQPPYQPTAQIAAVVASEPDPDKGKIRDYNSSIYIVEIVSYPYHRETRRSNQEGVTYC